MKSRNKKRIVKWVLPFAIPEIMCLIFFVYSFINHDTSRCAAIIMFGMIYIWVYTIICAILVPDDLINDLSKKDKD